MQINLNTTTWEDDLRVAMAGKQTVEIPVDVAEKLLDHYQNSPETQQCPACDEVIYIDYD